MMKLFSPIIVVILMISSGPATAQEAQHFTILFMSDSHGNLLPGGPRNSNLDGTVGGLARAATVIKKEKMKDQPVLTLHAGDMFTGDPYFGAMLSVPELQIMAQLGLDAMTIGNHEFDLTPDAFEAAIGGAFGGPSPFPLFGANISGLPSSALPAMSASVKNNQIWTWGSLKIGVFGLTTPNDPISIPAPLVIDTDLTGIATTQANALRNVGCDVVILLSHCGEAEDQTIAQSGCDVDIIIGGHDHYRYSSPQTVNGVLLAQAGAFYRQMGKMRIKVHKGLVQLHQYELIDLDSKIPEDPAIKYVVENLKSAVLAKDPKMFAPGVGINPVFMYEEELNPDTPGYHDTPVGSLVADAYKSVTDADIGIQPGGSTAQPLYAGPVTTQDLFRTIGFGCNPFLPGSLPGLPDLFGFPVVTFDLPGLVLLGLLDVTLGNLKNDEMLLQVSGNMNYTYMLSGSGGSLIDAEIDGDDIPTISTKTYTISTNLAVHQYVSDALTAMGYPVPTPTMHDAEYRILRQYLVNNGFPSRPYQQSRILSVAPGTENPF